MDNDKPAREYTDFTKDDVVVGEGSSFDDYVKLEPGEPYKAHVVEIKKGSKMKNGELVEGWMYVWYELDEGEGKGQRYRGDFNPVLSPKSNLQKFVDLIYGTHQSVFDPNDVIGKPVRVLLSEPWGEKGLQFVASYLKPTADQKKVEQDEDLDTVKAVFGDDVKTVS